MVPPFSWQKIACTLPLTSLHISCMHAGRACPTETTSQGPRKALASNQPCRREVQGHGSDTSNAMLSNKKSCAMVTYTIAVD